MNPEAEVIYRLSYHALIEAGKGVLLLAFGLAAVAALVALAVAYMRGR